MRIRCLEAAVSLNRQRCLPQFVGREPWQEFLARRLVVVAAIRPEEQRELPDFLEGRRCDAGRPIRRQIDRTVGVLPGERALELQPLAERPVGRQTDDVVLVLDFAGPQVRCGTHVRRKRGGVRRPDPVLRVVLRPLVVEERREPELARIAVTAGQIELFAPVLGTSERRVLVVVLLVDQFRAQVEIVRRRNVEHELQQILVVVLQVEAPQVEVEEAVVVGRRVDAAEQEIVPVPAEQHVITFVTEDDVVPMAPVDEIIPRIAADEIVEARAEQGVVICAAFQCGHLLFLFVV